MDIIIEFAESAKEFNNRLILGMKIMSTEQLIEPTFVNGGTAKTSWPLLLLEDNHLMLPVFKEPGHGASG
jgi:hypothetical protein